MRARHIKSSALLLRPSPISFSEGASPQRAWCCLVLSFDRARLCNLLLRPKEAFRPRSPGFGTTCCPAPRQPGFLWTSYSSTVALAAAQNLHGIGPWGAPGLIQDLTYGLHFAEERVPGGHKISVSPEMLR